MKDDSKPVRDYFSPNVNDKNEEAAASASCSSGSGASGCMAGSGPGGPCNNGSKHSW